MLACYGLALALLTTLPLPHVARADEEKPSETEPVRGVVRFTPAADEQTLPPRFQLKPHEFRFEQNPWQRIDNTVLVTRVEFPSPVKTEFAENNVVHCEFFQPLGEDGEPLRNTPGVVVLHILGGDFDLARLFCMAIAHRGGSALFLKMPYYGPRRPPNSSRRMVAPNPEQTVEGFTQAILDIRRATAWLGQQSTVDSNRLGVFGISLGAITGAMAMSVEPRLHNGCLLLAGGDLAKLFWESKETRKLRDLWIASGKSRAEFEAIVDEIEPLKLAPRARGRRILMLNAKEDEVVPKAATDALWNAFGKPPIHWYDGGHYSVGRHILSAVQKVGDFYAAAEPSKK